MSTSTEPRIRVLHEPLEEQAGRRLRRPAIWLAGLLVACVAATAASAALQRPVAEPPAVALPAAQPADAAGVSRRTPEAAAAAATNAVEQLGSDRVYDMSTRRPLLERVALAESVDGLDAGFSQAAAYLGLDASGHSAEGELVARVVPVGARIVSFSGDEAVVAVWSVGLLGIAAPTSRLPVQESWSTDTVTMTWAAARWQWAAAQHADGPAPVGSAQLPSAPGDLATATRDFTPAGPA